MSPDALRRWMLANHLSIRQAAAKLKVSPTSLQRWLKIGAPHSIGLAVSALVNGLGPFVG